MNETFTRRRVLAAGSGLVVLSLAGCSTGEPEARRPHFVMVYDQTKCVGCGECKAACIEANGLPEGQPRVILERSRLEERHYIRVSCQQCVNSPCVRVCPTKACHHDPETGIVTMDPDRCVGCKYCIAACPYNARFINEKTKTAENCDFCLRSRLSKGEPPACVSRCRYHALAFGDLNDPKSLVSRLVANKDTVRVRPWLGTDPSLRYIPVKKGG